MWSTVNRVILISSSEAVTLLRLLYEISRKNNWVWRDCGKKKIDNPGTINAGRTSSIGHVTGKIILHGTFIHKICDVIGEAKKLDNKRGKNEIHGKLHGIPILTEVLHSHSSFPGQSLIPITKTTPLLYMNFRWATTAGYFALVGAKAKSDADVAQRGGYFMHSLQLPRLDL